MKNCRMCCRNVLYPLKGVLQELRGHGDNELKTLS